MGQKQKGEKIEWDDFFKIGTDLYAAHTFITDFNYLTVYHQSRLNTKS